VSLRARLFAPRPDKRRRAPTFSAAPDVATKQDLEHQRVAVGNDMRQLGHEVRAEMARHGADLTKAIADLGTAMRAEMKAQTIRWSGGWSRWPGPSPRR
jgi:hypothetical protein